MWLHWLEQWCVVFVDGCPGVKVSKTNMNEIVGLCEKFKHVCEKFKLVRFCLSIFG